MGDIGNICAAGILRELRRCFVLVVVAFCLLFCFVLVVVAFCLFFFSARTCLISIISGEY